MALLIVDDEELVRRFVGIRIYNVLQFSLKILQYYFNTQP